MAGAAPWWFDLLTVGNVYRITDKGETFYVGVVGKEYRANWQPTLRWRAILTNGERIIEAGDAQLNNAVIEWID